MKVLILGDGMLGSEIWSQTGWDVLSRNKNTNFDFCDERTYYETLYDYDTIFNCIAHTKTYSKEREEHWNTNYIVGMNLVDWCNKNLKKYIVCSTDYIYANSVDSATEEDIPVHNPNWYSYTKLLADAYVQARAKDYLMFRCSFKPRPWPYDNAIVTQVGNFDYVNVIAKQMIQLINKGATGVYNLGTEDKTIYDLAKETIPDVRKSYATIHETMPTNITMCLDKFNKEMSE